MNKIKYIFTLIIITFIFACFPSCAKGKTSEKQETKISEMDKIVSKLAIPAGVRKDLFANYMKLYLEKWENYTVDSPGALEALNKYFGTSPYRVIWKWDTDGDGKIEYLGVEEYPGIVKGIKRGLLVSEDGTVKMIIDRNKGFYNPEYKMYDFETIGHKPGEIACIRLLFQREEVEFTKKQLDKYKFEKNAKNMIWGLGIFYFQNIDKDFKIISDYTNEKGVYVKNMMDQLLSGENWKVYFYMFNDGNLDEAYNFERKALLKYRSNKTAGLVFDAYNEEPEKVIK